MAHPDEVDSSGRCIICGDRLSAPIQRGRSRFRRHLSKRDCLTRGRREIVQREASARALAPLATRFHEAVLAVPAADRPVSLQRYPVGSCMDASIVFATLLVRLGFPDPRLISGDYFGALPSHSWLHFGSLDVDITAGQFPDAPAPIVITHHSAWHRSSFEEEADPGLAALRPSPRRGYERKLRQFGQVLWPALRW